MAMFLSSLALSSSSCVGGSPLPAFSTVADIDNIVGEHTDPLRSASSSSSAIGPPLAPLELSFDSPDIPSASSSSTSRSLRESDPWSYFGIHPCPAMSYADLDSIDMEDGFANSTLALASSSSCSKRPRSPSTGLFALSPLLLQMENDMTLESPMVPGQFDLPQEDEEAISPSPHKRRKHNDSENFRRKRIREHIELLRRMNHLEAGAKSDQLSVLLTTVKALKTSERSVLWMQKALLGITQQKILRVMEKEEHTTVSASTSFVEDSASRSLFSSMDSYVEDSSMAMAEVCFDGSRILACNMALCTLLALNRSKLYSASTSFFALTLGDDMARLEHALRQVHRSSHNEFEQRLRLVGSGGRIVHVDAIFNIVESIDLSQSRIMVTIIPSSD